VPFDRLACRAHWYALPQKLRTELLDAWRDGSVRAHAEARGKCVRYLEELNPA
jgi:hypothetical protein